MQGLRLDEAYGTPAQVPLHEQLLHLQYQLLQVQQLWLKRAWTLAAAHGDVRFHRDRVAAAIGV